MLANLPSVERMPQPVERHASGMAFAVRAARAMERMMYALVPPAVAIRLASQH